MDALKIMVRDCLSSNGVLGIGAFDWHFCHNVPCILKRGKKSQVAAVQISLNEKEKKNE